MPIDDVPQREAVGELLPETNRALWESVTARLAPDASAVALFAGLPAETARDSRRQIRALRLISARYLTNTGIRWLRLLQTARDVAQHQLQTAKLPRGRRVRRPGCAGAAGRNAACGRAESR